MSSTTIRLLQLQQEAERLRLSEQLRESRHAVLSSSGGVLSPEMRARAFLMGQQLQRERLFQQRLLSIEAQYLQNQAQENQQQHQLQQRQDEQRSMIQFCALSRDAAASSSMLQSNYQTMNRHHHAFVDDRLLAPLTSSLSMPSMPGSFQTVTTSASTEAPPQYRVAGPWSCSAAGQSIGAMTVADPGIDSSFASTAAEAGAASMLKKFRKKPKDQPRRALSAYNIFFKHERQRILDDIPVPEDGTSDEKIPRRAKRKSRNAHGKIGFENLAKLIGQRWQELGPDDVRVYKVLAENDKKRYQIAMDAYISDKKSQLLAATPDLASVFVGKSEQGAENDTLTKDNGCSTTEPQANLRDYEKQKNGEIPNVELDSDSILSLQCKKPRLVLDY